MLRQLPEHLPRGVPRLAQAAAHALAEAPAVKGRGRMIAGIAGGLFLAVLGFGILGGESAQPTPGDVTGSTAQVPTELGATTGLPIPRFVSLKANKVNVRKGPSSEHSVAWTFQQKGLPVEITAESDNWRKIRDADGSEGWILQSMLVGKRNVVVAEWAKAKPVYLMSGASPSSGIEARLAPGALAMVETCDGDWCYVSATDYEGYARQSDLWGVYPGEKVE